MREEDEDILFFAFRYALGRRTAAVSIMTTILFNRWKTISQRTRKQIQDEIRHEIAIGKASDDCDIKEWEKLLEL
jgi:hypothetical protein